MVLAYRGKPDFIIVMDNPPASNDAIRNILKSNLNELLRLAHKDSRFRDLLASAMAKEMPEHSRKKNGLDMNMVKEMKVILEAMMADGMDRQFLYSDTKLRPKTLELKLFRAMEYICDFDDEDGKFKTFRSQTELQPILPEIKGQDSKSPGLRLRIVRDANAPCLVARRVDEGKAETRQTISWRMALAQFMDDAKPGDGVHLKDLHLTRLDIDAIESMFIEQPQFTVMLVTEKEIKVLRNDVGL